jgi:flagellar motor switch protein FliN
MGDMLSQDEINELLGEGKGKLTNEERDVLGEIGNISMGTAATTLFALLNHKVSITTPKVSDSTYGEVMESYEIPSVAIRVDYKIGITGTNVMVLSQKDVKTIADLMMGGEGIISDNEPIELTDLDLSAISEAMNQMIGSSSTSLSSMVKTKVDIDTPNAFIMDLDTKNEIFERLGVNPDDEISTVSFNLKIGDLVDSKLIQIMDLNFSKELVRILKSLEEEVKPEAVEAAANQQYAQQDMSQQGMNQLTPEQMQFNQQQTQFNQQQSSGFNNSNLNVQPVQFQNFDISSVIQQKENIGIIMDVQLEVTVELGRTSKSIKEILEFTPGTIVELNKLAGEPIDILVNGKFIANGEVVVIDENFGIRITDIISVENRI